MINYMKISFNPTSLLNPTTLIENNVVNSKVDFIKKYGNLAENYNNLTPLGEQKQIWFYFILFLSLISTIVLFFMLKDKEKNSEGNIKEKDKTIKIFKLLAFVSLAILIGTTVYSGYFYFLIYSPQYNEWFKNLPTDARNQLNIINSLSMIANETRNYNKNNQSMINISKF